MHGFKCKLGPKCDENTLKLADAPNFGHTTSPQVWSVGSVSLQNTTIGSNMILDTSYSNEKVKKVDFEWFKLQIVADIDTFLHFLMLRLREF